MFFEFQTGLKLTLCRNEGQRGVQRALKWRRKLFPDKLKGKPQLISYILNILNDFLKLNFLISNLNNFLNFSLEIGWLIYFSQKIWKKMKITDFGSFPQAKVRCCWYLIGNLKQRLKSLILVCFVFKVFGCYSIIV